MNNRDLWLDVERESGETLIRLTAADRVAAGIERRRMCGTPLSLLSHRAFEVTALRCAADGPDCYGSLVVVRGCFEILTVSLHTILEGTETLTDERYDHRLPGRWPARGSWPTRLFNPPRQNLSFQFDHADPCTVTVAWRHFGGPL